jgi:dUTP pyrophosphatase
MVQPGERVAQLVIVPVYTPGFSQVKELDETERGIGGFGSTGK